MKSTGIPFLLATTSPRTPRAVLIVDDEPDILDALSAVLTASLDVDVVTAASGPAALACLDGRTFDLVISDFRMPAMNGIELLAQARIRQPCAHRLLLTAFPEPELARVARDVAGVGILMTKPVRRADLLLRVQAVLAKTSPSQGDQTP